MNAITILSILILSWAVVSIAILLLYIKHLTKLNKKIEF